MTPPVQSDRRDHLLNTAETLFCKHGFQAVGIDRLLKEAGVAKMTLYKHFPSKDELIATVLHRKSAAWHKAFWAQVEKTTPDPKGQLLGLFDVIADWLGSAERENFRGCAFGNAISEFADPSHPARKAATEHKDQVLEGLTRLTAQTQANDPAQLAEQLMLLIEGVTATVQASGRLEAIDATITAADALINCAIKP